ncbi:MAG TPA: hypothetical protein PK357_03580 [Candidatus Pacearchaeota archaeon]|nr:hypothetical protein [Candidatus Pacearchaeota archaeon]
MKRNICYDEKEVRENVNDIYNELNDITEDLAMFSQQFDGERANIDSSYIKSTVMPKINRMVDLLNDFGLGDKTPLDLDEKRKSLLDAMKEGIY